MDTSGYIGKLVSWYHSKNYVGIVLYVKKGTVHLLGGGQDYMFGVLVNDEIIEDWWHNFTIVKGNAQHYNLIKGESYEFT